MILLIELDLFLLLLLLFLIYLKLLIFSIEWIRIFSFGYIHLNCFYFFEDMEPKTVTRRWLNAPAVVPTSLSGKLYLLYRFIGVYC